jgi:hypothetical protein
LLENCIKDRVGDLVGNLIGVAFRDGFGGKQKIIGHRRFFLSVDFCRGQLIEPATL